MRPVRIIATLAVVVALAVTGCGSRSADQAAAPASSAPSSAPTTQPAAAATTRTTAGTAGTTTTTMASPTTAEVLAAAKATASGQVAASFAVPSGFAGSHYPGRRDTFQVKGRQSGTVASATFTVTG